MATTSPALLELEENVVDGDFEEGYESLSDHDIDEPWDWLTDDEDLDEETRDFVSWFQAHVQEDYDAQEKIQSRIVDMDLCARLAPEASTTKDAMHPAKDESATRSKRSIFEVDTAASLGQLTDEEVNADTGAEAAIKPQFEKHVKQPLQPSPPLAAQGGRNRRRPQMRHASDPEQDRASSESRRAPRQLVPPAAPRQPSSAELGKLRLKMYSAEDSIFPTHTEASNEKQAKAAQQQQQQQPQQQQQQQQKAAPLTVVMVGPPASALRKVGCKASN